MIKLIFFCLTKLSETDPFPVRRQVPNPFKALYSTLMAPQIYLDLLIVRVGIRLLDRQPVTHQVGLNQRHSSYLAGRFASDSVSAEHLFVNYVRIVPGAISSFESMKILPLVGRTFHAVILI